DYERRQIFNTAIAAVMELYNELSRFAVARDIQDGGQNQAVAQEAMEAIVLMLAPIVPHLCHVLWNHLGHDGAVIDATWPGYDEAALRQSSIQIVAQVNGKVRSQLQLPAGATKVDMEAAALADESVRRYTDGKDILKVIVV